ncbi:MAG: LytTR family transcriptional regulator DNA-binding domain-containing protein [Bacteroidota bacterium]
MKSCLVVEDSRLARQEMIALLEEVGVFDEIHAAADAEQAALLISDHQPAVLFLDIHLPGKNGFELLESLDQVPQVIFTTAYDEYAIRSFEYNAIDYLLKPIKKDRLEKALQKLPLPAPTPAAPLMEQVFVREGEKCWFVKLTDIGLIESVGNYSRLYFGEEKPLIQRSLHYLEGVLDPSRFFRANRQQMINLGHIGQIDTWFNGKLKVTLKSGQEVEVSRRRSLQLKKMFSL